MKTLFQVLTFGVMIMIGCAVQVEASTVATDALNSGGFYLYGGPNGYGGDNYGTQLNGPFGGVTITASPSGSWQAGPANNAYFGGDLQFDGLGALVGVGPGASAGADNNLGDGFSKMITGVESASGNQFTGLGVVTFTAGAFITDVNMSQYSDLDRLTVDFAGMTFSGFSGVASASGMVFSTETTSVPEIPTGIAVPLVLAIGLGLIWVRRRAVRQLV